MWIYIKFKSTMTKWPVQKPTHRTTQKHIHLEEKNYNYFLCVFVCIFLGGGGRFFFIYNFLNDLSKKCWVTKLSYTIVTQEHNANQIYFINFG